RKTEGDGGNWIVNPESKETLSVVNDVYVIHMVKKTQTQHEELRARFKNEPLFKEVIDVILNIDTDTPICK
ncbi:hypothetical protein HD554DRAFT_2030990, partial [Boletus coccyginus]